MQRSTLVGSLIALLLLGCNDPEVKEKPNPEVAKTVFLDEDTFFHVGYDAKLWKSYLYKTDAAGTIEWIKEQPDQASLLDHIIPFSDGSLLYGPLGCEFLVLYSASGEELWRTEFSEFVLEIFVHEQELWLITLPAASTDYGLKVVSRSSGEISSSQVLTGFKKASNLLTGFSYHDGFVIASNPREFDYTEVVKFNADGIVWRESNDEDIEPMVAETIIHHANGFSVQFDEIMLRFDESGKKTGETSIENNLASGRQSAQFGSSITLITLHGGDIHLKQFDDDFTLERSVLIPTTLTKVADVLPHSVEVNDIKKFGSAYFISLYPSYPGGIGQNLLLKIDEVGAVEKIEGLNFKQ